MKKVKMSDVAQAAGVSITTVSRVLNHNGYVAEEKRRAVERAMEQMRYPVQESKAEPASNLVGLVLRKLSVNMFYDKLHTALLQAAEAQGLRTMAVFSSSVDSRNLREHVEKLLPYRLRGIVVCGFSDCKMDEELRTFLLNCGIPVVFIERPSESYGFNKVLVDNHVGSYRAAQHLVRAGHRKMLYITRDLNGQVEAERTRGFLRAIEEAEDPPEYRVIHCTGNDVEDGYRAMREADQEMPGITGVMAWYDGYAAGVMQYLYEQHRRVPEDVEVIGHDDTYAPLLAPAISSIRIPYEAMGNMAIQLVMEDQRKTGLSVPRTVLLETEFILR